MDCGIVYVATKLDRTVEEAFLSAESLKRQVPELPITLYTDRPENLLCRAGCFDAVEVMESCADFGSAQAEAELDRIVCLSRAPYARTLYLDAGTRVLTRAVTGLFKLLDGCDLAMVEEPVAFGHAREQSGRRMFASAVILFRRSEPVSEWLKQWETRLRRNLTLALVSPLPAVPELAHVADEGMRRDLLRDDRIALMEVLSPEVKHGALRVMALDESWDFRGGTPAKAINIERSEEIRASIRPDILSVANAWMKSGREDRARALYDYVGALAPTRQLRAYWPLALTCKSSDRVGEEWATPRLKSADLHINYDQPQLAAEILHAVTDGGQRAQVLTGHARLALACGAQADALKLAEQARAIAPLSSYTAIIQGAALIAAGRPHDAIPHLTMAGADGRAGAFFLLGLAWTKLENYGEAAAAYSKAIAFDAEDPGPVNNLLPALAGQKDYRAVLEYADSLLARRPGHTTSLAFKSIALGELGQQDDLRFLVDQNALVAIEQLEPPPGYQDLAAFNRALAGEVAAEATLMFERNTTRFGYQTDDIATTSAPAIQALQAAIMAAARRRADGVRKPSDHPFDQAAPRAFRLYSWGVVLHEKGHQTPHFHPHGWLSGVYYIEVPDEIEDSDPAQNGWLEFGRGDERWQRKTTVMPTRQVCLKPGLLITFPSFYWHNTRPLRSNKPRVSFAFDVIPI